MCFSLTTSPIADWTIFFGLFWALLLLVSCLLVPPLLAKRWSRINRAALLLLVGVTALGARLVPNLVLPVGAGYDIESYQIVGGLFLQGQDVYTSPEAMNRHPYLPFQMYWMALSLLFSRTFNLPFVKIVRLLPILADTLIALLLTTYRYPDSPEDALRRGFTYALNPVTVFVSAYHGQFDALPALFLALAICSLERSPIIAGIWLGMGILDKSWPVLAFPTFLKDIRLWKKRFAFCIAVWLIPVIGVGLYAKISKAPVLPILGRALSYNWGVGVWGYTYFFYLVSTVWPIWTAPFQWLVRDGRYLTLAALGVIWVWRARRESPAAGLLTTLVGFFAVTHAFSIQYPMWVIPFALIGGAPSDTLWLRRYTLAIFCYMALTYSVFILTPAITHWMPWNQADTFIIRPIGLPAWGICVAWLVQRLKREPPG